MWPEITGGEFPRQGACILKWCTRSQNSAALSRLARPRVQYLTGWGSRGYFLCVKPRFQAGLATLAFTMAHLGFEPVSSAEPVPNQDQLLTQIAALEKPAEQAKTLKPSLDSAKSALNRARDARAAGDVEHGSELEALAADYVTIAKDTLRAAELESGVRKAQDEYTKTETARRQTETLLEATVAQRERTKSQLVQLRAEREAKKPTVSAKPETNKNGKGAKK